VVEAALDTVRPTADAKQVALAVRCDPGPTIVAGDADRLQQVLWNLLSNAIRYTPAGGRIDVELHRADGHAEIQVADTGVGIEPHFLPHVFERFRQADASASRTHGGLGLGLALVRHLVELHGGTVRAESEGDGRGAIFTVRLPMQAAPVSARAGAHGDASPPGRLSGLRILVVDDDMDSRDLARIVCEQAGASVVSVESAAAALRALDAGSVDVLVTDIGMPGTDGYELLTAVRARPDGRIPAIALTAYARLEDRERALNAGFRLHVPKPLDPTRLARAVALVVGRESAL
jgi:CheY-like chemotaxis protein/anti-sigma regulatory factor (Ser/Thr protein kinase)